MAAGATDRRLAFDSNVLLDLAFNDEVAHRLLDHVNRHRYKLFVPPTVVQELAYEADTGQDWKAAKLALTSMRDWGILPYDLRAVGHGITEQFANTLICKQLLPAEELNDGQIVAEVALNEIPDLVTCDRHLYNIPHPDLLETLDSKGMSEVQIWKPRDFLNHSRSKYGD